MIETAIALLAAHMLGDFVFQPGWMIKHKRHPGVLLLHVAIVTALSAALLGALDPLVLGLIAGTHLVMDALKLFVLSPKSLEGNKTAPAAVRRLRAFVLDQGVHIAVILVCARLRPDAFSTDWLHAVIPAEIMPGALWLATLTLIAGGIGAVLAGGHLIRLTVETIPEPPDTGERGLPGAGRLIGWLERTVILMLMLADKPEGIAFLIAAKSILRFGEANAPGQRHVAEYIIIGTLMSVGWAMALGYLTRAGIAFFIPELMAGAPA
jgi:hypothetical protein